MDHEELDLCLRRRGMDGNDDEKVAVLDASEIGWRMGFCASCNLEITDVQTFDPETGLLMCQAFPRTWRAGREDP